MTAEMNNKPRVTRADITDYSYFIVMENIPAESIIQHCVENKLPLKMSRWIDELGGVYTFTLSVFDYNYFLKSNKGKTFTINAACNGIYLSV